jgi:hypothetical protein
MGADTHSAGERNAPRVGGDHRPCRHERENNQVRYGRHGAWYARRPDQTRQTLYRCEVRVRPAKVDIGVAASGIAYSERCIGRVVAAGAAGWFVLWLLVQSLAG